MYRICQSVDLAILLDGGRKVTYCPYCCRSAEPRTHYVLVVLQYSTVQYCTVLYSTCGCGCGCGCRSRRNVWWLAADDIVQERHNVLVSLKVVVFSGVSMRPILIKWGPIEDI